MNNRAEFSRWVRVAEYLLAPQDVRGIIDPTIADALFERNAARSRLGWLWRTRIQLACALGGAVAASVRVRLTETHWFGFIALLLAGLSGAAAIKHGPLPQIAHNQLTFLVLAAILGIAVVAVPWRLLRSLGTATIVLAWLGLIACPWLGVSYDDRSQWLRFGPLQLHVATLALPGFAVFARRAAVARARALLMGGTLGAIGLLLLQHNLEAAFVYILTAATAMVEGRFKWLSWVMTLGLAVAVGLATILTPLGSGWTLLGVAALAFAVGWGIFPEVLRTRPRASAQSLSMAMVSLLLLRSIGVETLPVVGFGGSALVAFFVLVALQMRGPRSVIAT